MSTAASALIVPGATFALIDRIRMRREALKDSKNFSPLGKMIRINFDPSGMHRPDQRTIDHVVVSPNSVGWTKEPGMRNAAGNRIDFPSVVISNDDQDLMVIPPLAPLPEVNGPDFDDPSTWVKTNLPGWQTMRGGDPRTVGKMPRRYRQHYGDLTDDFIGKSCRDGAPDFSDADTFYVLQPINQILLHPFGSDNQALLQPERGIDGTRMAFLVNPRTGEAHFIGGRVYITNRIHTLPAGAKP
jgi:hypothetical protein